MYNYPQLNIYFQFKSPGIFAARQSPSVEALLNKAVFNSSETPLDETKGQSNEESSFDESPDSVLSSTRARHSCWNRSLVIMGVVWCGGRLSQPLHYFSHGESKMCIFLARLRNVKYSFITQRLG